MIAKAKKINFKILSIFICLILTMFAFSGCKADNDYTGIIDENFEPTTATIFEDDMGYSSIKMNEERDLKILQLTDLHIGNGLLCVKKDRKAFQDVCSLIENTNPDLIVLTGDLVYPIVFATGSNDNLSALKEVAQIIERYEIPWTLCFGNHDAESCALFSKSELCNYLESDELEYCLFERGPSELNGMGNHIVNVYNSDNSFNTSIVLFDNGDYANGYQLSGYAPISQNQTDWYTNSINSINEFVGKTVQSFVFYHIPSRDYLYAWQAYLSGSPDAIYHYGWANESNEKISCPDLESPLFDAILNLGSTKGIFCGHNHLNDFSITYKGIRLTFSKSIDYVAYPGIASKTEQRGGTLLTLKGLNSSMTENFTVEAIKITDL